MKPTSVRFLFAIAMLAGVAGVTASRITLAMTSMLLQVRATSPMLIGIMCAGMWWWTLIVRRRMPHLARARHEALRDGTPFVMRDRPLEPIVAARTVALAFAASRAGAVVAGYFLGLALTFAERADIEDIRLRLILAVLAAGLATLLAVIAVWLERSCKLPPPPPPGAADSVTT